MRLNSEKLRGMNEVGNPFVIAPVDLHLLNLVRGQILICRIKFKMSSMTDLENRDYLRASVPLPAASGSIGMASTRPESDIFSLRRRGI
jgi:hypothetical protein